MGIWPQDHYCHYYYYALALVAAAEPVPAVAVIVVVVVFVPALAAGLAAPCRAWSKRAGRPSRGW